MHSAVVTILSLGLMLLISASYITGALRQRKHHKHAGTVQQHVPPVQLQNQFIRVPQLQNGIVIGTGEPAHRTAFSLPHSWYTRRRTLVSLGLLMMILLALFVQSGLVDGALQSLGKSLNLISDSSNSSINTAAQSVADASQQLARISQLDPNQYSSAEEFNTWAYSACSAASMTEVFDAYGYHYRITDVLKVEAQIGEITPSQGLLRPEGIQQTAAQFGFKTTWGTSWTLDQVIAHANQGNPVIVSFPPDRYAGGHILVVIGGNSTTVFLADTSLWNRHSLSRAQFLQWWEGFAAVVTPN